MLDRFLGKLSKEVDLGDFSVDRQGVHTLRLSGYDVVMRERNGGAHMSSEVGAMPQKHSEKWLSRVMEANFLGQGTGGGVLGLSEDETVLTLSASVSFELEYTAFRETLESFLNYLDYWSQELIDHESEACRK